MKNIVSGQTLILELINKEDSVRQVCLWDAIPEPAKKFSLDNICWIDVIKLCVPTCESMPPYKELAALFPLQKQGYISWKNNSLQRDKFYWTSVEISLSELKDKKINIPAKNKFHIVLFFSKIEPRKF